MPNSEMIPLILELILWDIKFLDLWFEVGLIKIDFDFEGLLGDYKLNPETSLFFPWKTLDSVWYFFLNISSISLGVLFLLLSLPKPTSLTNSSILPNITLSLT